MKPKVNAKCYMERIKKGGDETEREKDENFMCVFQEVRGEETEDREVSVLNVVEVGSCCVVCTKIYFQNNNNKKKGRFSLFSC